MAAVCHLDDRRSAPLYVSRFASPVSKSLPLPGLPVLSVPAGQCLRVILSRRVFRWGILAQFKRSPVSLFRSSICSFTGSSSGVSARGFPSEDVSPNSFAVAVSWLCGGVLVGWGWGVGRLMGGWGATM